MFYQRRRELSGNLVDAKSPGRVKKWRVQSSNKILKKKNIVRNDLEALFLLRNDMPYTRLISFFTPLRAKKRSHYTKSRASSMLQEREQGNRIMKDSRLKEENND